MRITASTLALFACSFLARSQAPTAGFEAASVRLAVANRDPEPIQSTPGSLTIRGQSLQACLQWAYGMPRVQISGPGWLNDVRLDILAKAARPADDAHLRMMLRSLLAERMSVTSHIERKEMPVYALTLSEGGAKFHESTTEGPPPPWRSSEGVLSAVRVSMSDLAEQISEPLNRPVIDATGLKSRYDIRIDISAYMLSAASSERGAGEMDPMSTG
jgi:uncharacterized protein (TIGR03435 family)